MKKLILALLLSTSLVTYAQEMTIQDEEQVTEWAHEDAEQYYNKHPNTHLILEEADTLGLAWAIKYRHLHGMLANTYALDFALALSSLYQY